LPAAAVAEPIAAALLVEMLELVAAELDLQTQQLQRLELQTLAAAAAAQVSVELAQVHLKVAMVDQV
jgi:hypothetical protein